MKKLFSLSLASLMIMSSSVFADPVEPILLYKSLMSNGDFLSSFESFQDKPNVKLASYKIAVVPNWRTNDPLITACAPLSFNKDASILSVVYDIDTTTQVYNPLTGKVDSSLIRTTQAKFFANGGTNTDVDVCKDVISDFKSPYLERYY